MRSREDRSPRLGTGGRIAADINVTPLVDVCLVLLIIFMVLTPMINEGVSVDLPETDKPAALAEDKAAIVIAVKADGRISVGTEVVTLDRLGERVRAQVTGAPERTLVLRGDRTLDYATVREVMKRLSEAGFSRASLATLRRG
ncbi:MAG: ExbD/TolR family protein [Thermoanaerobaculaceae bacterium]|jgi:biopolymer transport protein ExbD/biopolymer transport protein TolR|nr:ExbD/TolR family protein [Thermoanaerobaculaceae bacterium]